MKKTAGAVGKVAPPLTDRLIEGSKRTPFLDFQRLTDGLFAAAYDGLREDPFYLIFCGTLEAFRGIKRGAATAPF